MNPIAFLPRTLRLTRDLNNIPAYSPVKPYLSSAPIALVLADVDGTLVTNDKVLTDRSKDAIGRLRQRGILFAITSGRPPRGMKMVNDALHLDTPIAGFNGGVFVNPDWSVITSHTLSSQAAAKAIEIIRKHQLTAWLYTPEDWYIPDPAGSHVAREAWTVKFDAKVLRDFTPLLGQAVKIVGVSDDLAAVAACETECREVLRTSVSAARSQPYYLDVTHPEATKGFVVTYLSQHLRIPLEQIATMGDMPNDVLMFEKSGLSIAMGNASSEVQAQANFVTASNEHEGFALAIDKFILKTEATPLVNT
jgi:Cof subfamily protein (haloacid dehalogenase superfamily)